MRRKMLAAILGLFAMGFVGCGSGGADLTPQEACNQGMADMCKKLNDCMGATVMAMAGYTSVADCTTKMEAEQCTAVNIACTAPKKYSASTAQACINAVNGMSCTDVTSTNTPAICDQVCQ